MLFFSAFLLFILSLAFGQSVEESNLVIQDFEKDFIIQSAPGEFLPGWQANEIRSGSSRIFQVNELGLGGSRALAVQPISTFDGELTVKMDLMDFEDPVILFYARSLRNGSGSRAAEVYYSYGADDNFSDAVLLGEPDEFQNEDQVFREFNLGIPDSLKGKEIQFRFQIRYGEGTGTAARWILDDFCYGDFVPDTTPPEITEVRGFDFNEIQVGFSEPIDPVFSQFFINYTLDGIEPIEIELVKNSIVNLRFEQDLEEGIDYELLVQSISDLSGNESQGLSFSFEFFDPTNIPKNGLIVNELMPAPRSGNDLPNSEYLELIHTGEKSYRLDSVILEVEERSVILPEVWMEPDELVLLVPEGSGVDFLEYGPVIELDPWLTLLNSGAMLKLKNGQEFIDKISYSSTSWGDSELASGGYSLEVMNPFLLCDQSPFLQPSIDPMRGTPGKINSVLDLTPDQDPPRLQNFGFMNANSLYFEFDESISESAEDTILELVGFTGLDSVSFVGAMVTFYSSVPFNANQVYEVINLSVLDCSGNVFEGPFPFEMVFPREAEIGEVLINELLFNPISGTPKFLELANATQDYLEIGGWFLGNEDDFGEANSLKQLSEKSLILTPNSFLAITSDTSRLKLTYPQSQNGNFFQINSLPSYPISGGVVRLLDSGVSPADRFEYNEDLHHPLIRDSKGVSLERISLKQETQDPQNWQSAAEDKGFATPGGANSQTFEAERTDELISIDPEVFDPEGSNGETFTQISYSFEQSGWVGTFRIYDLNGRLVQPLAENAVLGTSGFYTWTGTDQTGTRVPVGYYVLLVELFNPSGETLAIKKTIVIARRL